MILYGYQFNLAAINEPVSKTTNPDNSHREIIAAASPRATDFEISINNYDIPEVLVRDRNGNILSILELNLTKGNKSNLLAINSNETLEDEKN